MEDRTLRAVDSMAELFYALLCSSDDFEGFEADAMDACMASAPRPWSPPSSASRSS